MLEELKQALQKSQERVGQLVDKCDEQLSDWSEDAVEAWELQAKPRLQQLQSSLNEAASAAHTQADEAHLKAHLAIMDAHDQWLHLSKAVGELARHGAKASVTQLQQADLQAHLAAMETRDFINEHGPAIRQDYQIAREKVEKASKAALQELETSLEKMGDIWARMK